MDPLQAAGALLAETSPAASWGLSLLGTALFLAPGPLAFFFAKNRLPRLRGALAGFVFGTLAWSLSFWLYLHYYLEGARKFLLGYPGLWMVELHCKPLVLLAISAHPEAPRGAPFFAALVLTSTFWGLSYGLVGLGVDYLRIKRSGKPAA